MHKRVIVKLSGEALSNYKQGILYDASYIDMILDELLSLQKAGVQVSVVMGGGNIWRGAKNIYGFSRVKGDHIGLLATIQNAVYVQGCLTQKGISSVVQTPFPVGNITEVFSMDATISYLAAGKIVIYAGGIGHPYFSSDMVTALRAVEIDADGIYYTKNAISGICERDPKGVEVLENGKTARRFKRISCKRIIQDDQIKAIDDAAICLLRENKKDFYVFGLEKGSLLKAASGEQIGTLVTYEDKECEFYVE